MVFQLIDPAVPAYDRFVYDVYALAHAATGLPVRRESAAAFRPLLDGPALAAALASLTGVPDTLGTSDRAGRADRICRYVVETAGPAGFVLTLKVLRRRGEPAPPSRVPVLRA
jgi:hypothetical protein